MSHVPGSDSFRDKIQGYIEAGAEEVPRVQRFVVRKSLQKLERATSTRAEWMTEAYREHGYSMREKLPIMRNCTILR